MTKLQRLIIKSTAFSIKNKIRVLKTLAIFYFNTKILKSLSSRNSKMQQSKRDFVNLSPVSNIEYKPDAGYKVYFCYRRGYFFLGKGIIAASLAKLLQAQSFKVTIQSLILISMLILVRSIHMNTVNVMLLMMEPRRIWTWVITKDF